jgi:hypothetical protein
MVDGDNPIISFCFVLFYFFFNHVIICLSSISALSSVGSDVLRRRVAAAAAATEVVDGGAFDVVGAGAVDASPDFLDNYELDAEGGDKYTLSQKMAHYCGGAITQEHWAACKAVLCFHAGCATSKLSQMTKVLKEAAMLELYVASVDRLDPLVFCEGARTFFAVLSGRKMSRLRPSICTGTILILGAPCAMSSYQSFQKTSFL